MPTDILNTAFREGSSQHGNILRACVVHNIVTAAYF